LTNEIYLIACIPPVFWFALWLQSRRHKKPKTILQPILLNKDGVEEHEVYDPSQDPKRIMRGEIESYFD
jgi:hypothetical protein